MSDYFENVQMIGWLIQPKLGTDRWFLIEVPGGYQEGMAFPERTVWHEHATADDAWADAKRRMRQPEDDEP
jgi:hypothetical protein